MFTSYENEKKTEYGPRAREVEKATASHSEIQPKSTDDVGRAVSFLCFPLKPLREIRTLFSKVYLSSNVCD